MRVAEFRVDFERAPVCGDSFVAALQRAIGVTEVGLRVEILRVGVDRLPEIIYRFFVVAL